MFEKKVWNDRQSEHPARRRLTPTENDNEYEVSRAEGLVMEEGDAFDATTMNDLESRVAKAFAEYDPAELGAVNVTVQLYTCKKEGKVYQLTGSGAVGRCKIPAAWASGDTWTVNGTTVSAYCGAVCAATGAGCAMTYLDGGTLEQIDQTITNSIATSSGMVCDGAKPSCAAKIATSLESAIMAHDLAMANRAFQSGEGIVMDNVEQTIDAVGCVASQGMHITDQVILNLMTQQKGVRA